jgi:hypothetical protein
MHLHSELKIHEGHLCTQASRSDQIVRAGISTSASWTYHAKPVINILVQFWLNFHVHRHLSLAFHGATLKSLQRVTFVSSSFEKDVLSPALGVRLRGGGSIPLLNTSHPATPSVLAPVLPYFLSSPGNSLINGLLGTRQFCEGGESDCGDGCCPFGYEYIPRSL